MSRRILEGTIVSNKMDKTVVVSVSRVYRHPLYKKNVKVVKKYAAHDEENSYKEGEVVQIRESRPFSKSKKFEVLGLVSLKNAAPAPSGGAL
jgi:small subunit ribosomal protein S17